MKEEDTEITVTLGGGGEMAPNVVKTGNQGGLPRGDDSGLSRKHMNWSGDMRKS